MPLYLNPAAPISVAGIHAVCQQLASNSLQLLSTRKAVNVPCQTTCNTTCAEFMKVECVCAGALTTSCDLLSLWSSVLSCTV
jgi:hypothetical protein